MTWTGNRENVTLRRLVQRLRYLISDELWGNIAGSGVGRSLHVGLRVGRCDEVWITGIPASSVLPGTCVPRGGGVLVRSLHLYHYPVLRGVLAGRVRGGSLHAGLESPLRRLAGQYRRVTVTRITDHHDIAGTEYVHSLLVVVVRTGHVADSLGLTEVTVGGMKAGGRGGGPVAGRAQG